MRAAKTIIGIIFIAVLAGLYFNRPKPIPKPNEIVLTEVDSARDIDFNGTKFEYLFFLADPKKTKLIANFDEKITSKQISINNNCLYGINGSFYNDKREPLAGWVANGQVRKNITHNNLLNGYVGISDNNEVWLGKNIPDEKMLWGMQTGPVLITNGIIEKLNTG